MCSLQLPLQLRNGPSIKKSSFWSIATTNFSLSKKMYFRDYENYEFLYVNFPPFRILLDHKTQLIIQLDPYLVLCVHNCFGMSELMITSKDNKLFLLHSQYSSMLYQTRYGSPTKLKSLPDRGQPSTTKGMNLAPPVQSAVQSISYMASLTQRMNKTYHVKQVYNLLEC